MDNPVVWMVGIAWLCLVTAPLVFGYSYFPERTITIDELASCLDDGSDEGRPSDWL